MNEAPLVILGLIALTAACAAPAGQPGPPAEPDGLSPCPDAPKCVSSLSQDPDRRLPPLTYADSRSSARRRLLQIIEELPRSRVVVDQGDYIRAEFKSRVFGFVDDTEFLFSEDGHTIHFRSSARLGWYDFGVNRQRMAEIRKRFQGSR